MNTSDSVFDFFFCNFFFFLSRVGLPSLSEPLARDRFGDWLRSLLFDLSFLVFLPDFVGEALGFLASFGLASEIRYHDYIVHVVDRSMINDEIINVF